MITALPKPANFAVVGTSTTNTSLTVTVPAPPTNSPMCNALSALNVSWTGAAPGAGVDVQVYDGTGTGTLLFDAYLGSTAATQGNNTWTWHNPLRSTVGNALTVIVAAGGASVVAKVSLSGFTFNPTDT